VLIVRVPFNNPGRVLALPAEVSVLEDNSRFLSLISDRQMPSVKRGVIPLKDFGKRSAGLPILFVFSPE